MRQMVPWSTLMLVAIALALVACQAAPQTVVVTPRPADATAPPAATNLPSAPMAGRGAPRPARRDQSSECPHGGRRRPTTGGCATATDDFRAGPAVLRVRPRIRYDARPRRRRGRRGLPGR